MFCSSDRELGNPGVRVEGSLNGGGSAVETFPNRHFHNAICQQHNFGIWTFIFTSHGASLAARPHIIKSEPVDQHIVGQRGSSGGSTIVGHDVTAGFPMSREFQPHVTKEPSQYILHGQMTIRERIPMTIRERIPVVAQSTCSEHPNVKKGNGPSIYTVTLQT